MDSDEVQRLRRVYAQYERVGKWDVLSPGREQMSLEQVEAMHRLVHARLNRPLSECRILDLGCGGGKLLGWFHEQGATASNLVGIDLLARNVETASRHYPAFEFREANAENLDFPDSSFDLISAFTVFSSILNETMARNVAQTIMRLLKPDGALLWYDLRYPNPGNRQVQAMTRSRVRRLFPGWEREFQSISLLPPLADRLGSHADRIYPLLATIPLLRSHYFGLLRPARTQTFGDG